MRAPLHLVQLSSKFVLGQCRVAVRSQLPVAGIDMILGHYLAGNKVFPSPEVVEDPMLTNSVPVPAELDLPRVSCVRRDTHSRKEK